jgi:uroporphyrinogen III methyltransferase/synthase
MINVLVSPADADRELAATLERSGARVSSWPRVEIGAPADETSLHEAIENLFGYDWLLLKNARAADYFLRAFFLQHRTEELDELRVLTIGSETAQKLAGFQVHVDVALEHFGPADVYREIESYVGGSPSLSGQNLLVPSANVIIESFDALLVNAGARVDAPTAYQTCSERLELVRLRTVLAGGGVDSIVFSGESAVAEFATLFDTDDLARLLTGVRVACLDRATGDLAGNYGLSDTLIPSEASIPGLAQIIAAAGQ